MQRQGVLQCLYVLRVLHASCKNAIFGHGPTLRTIYPFQAGHEILLEILKYIIMP